MIEIRDAYAALADKLDSISGLRAVDHVPGQSEWPAAFILPPTVEYETLADHNLKLTFEIVVLVSAVLDKNQLKLLEFQDPHGENSVLAAIRQDPFLGVNGVHAYAIRSRSLSWIEQAGYNAFGCAFEVAMRLS